MKLSLFSLNLKGFTDRDMRVSKIIEIIKTKNPDIIIFQEVCSDKNRKGGTALDMINKELGYPYQQYAKCFNFSEDYGKGIRLNKHTGKVDCIDEGLGVLSKIPFSSSIINLPIQKGFDRWPRIALKCNFDTFCLVNLHYSPSSSAFMQWQETPKEDIIIGDFNMKPLEIKEVQGSYTTSYDFKNYVSFPSERTTFDYCLLKTGNITSLEIFDQELSDHVGLYLEIEI